ncbi:MAG: response regulator [Rhodocyclaceae bacterium]|jgi:CheY-like chemotaxis protein|nr:response regulator [Rhodocyclaceae bacterium]
MTTPPSSLAGCRVLVAEDDSLLQLLLSHILGEAGIDVTLAADGLQALALAGRQRFDWVLMDVFMPGMDGLEATRRLRADAETAAVCIIGLSGNDDRDSLDACRAAGMSDFLAKPVDTEILLERLRYWLGRPHDAAAFGEEADDRVPRTPAIDLARLDQLADGDAERARAHAGHFLAALETGQAAMAQALATGELDRLGGEAHRLKSSARWVGALYLGDRFAALEAAARAGDRDRLPSLLENCRLAGADFSDCLQRHLAQASAAGARWS